MLPLCVEDIICKYLLSIRIAHINQEVKERYTERIRNVSKEELTTNVSLWLDWIDCRQSLDSYKPFQNYGEYLNWLNTELFTW